VSFFVMLSPQPLEEQTARHRFTIGADLAYVETSGYLSWTEGYVGKLRFDDDSDGLVFSRGFVDYEGRLSDTLHAKMALEIYADDLGAPLDFTEAYLQWRPVPRSPNRYRLKFGAFYPRISLENTEAGWSSPYTLSSSTINTWVAEELRTVGAEFFVSRRPVSLGGAHQFGLQVATFWGNDPTGSLLAWKGWSAHDRQSRFGDELPLPPLPQIQPGMLFESQDAYVAPFREIDGRMGFYVSGEWQFGPGFLLRAMHFDNRGDPTIFEDGQYSWHTEFDHIGGQLSLPANFAVIAQWMKGSTVMGQIVNGTHMVDTEFDSKFFMLTKLRDRHRLTLRYDNFDVTENDQTVEDNNSEEGHVWTATYRYDISDKMSFSAEWLSIKTFHSGWIYYGLDPTRTETQLQLGLQLRFSN
jgi:hypothetical protein